MCENNVAIGVPELAHELSKCFTLRMRSVLL